MIFRSVGNCQPNLWLTLHTLYPCLIRELKGNVSVVDPKYAGQEHCLQNGRYGR